MSELRQAVISGSKTVTTLGVIAMILGVLALLAPAAAGLSIAMLLGFIVTIAGVLRLVWTFKSGERGNSLFRFAMGLLTLICGIALLANPVIGSAMMTIVITIYFLLDGLSEFATGISTGSFWMLLGGGVSILLGLMIWAQYPLSGAWAMGILIGIKLFSIGLIMFKGGSAVRTLASA